jgi:PAS domain S-box-containing protein
MEYVDSDREDVVDTPLWETPWWTPEIADDLKAWVERAATGEYVTYEADLSRSNGDLFSVEGVIRPVRTDECDVVSLIVSARGVTERKRRERNSNSKTNSSTSWRVSSHTTCKRQ